MTKRFARTILLALSFVLMCAAVVYAATFYATMEWPFYISGYSTLTATSTSATARSETLTQALQIWYDPFRAHCQLWEDGHFANYKDKTTSTWGQYKEIFTAYCSATSEYDGNWWVYGVHQAYGPLDYNDITSDGYVSSARRGAVDLLTWNDPAMAIAQANSSKSARVIPWYELASGQALLGEVMGRHFVTTIIDAVVPQLEKGDLLPAVSVDEAAAVATVFVPRIKGGYSIFTLKLPEAHTPAVEAR